MTAISTRDVTRVRGLGSVSPVRQLDPGQGSLVFQGDSNLPAISFMDTETTHFKDAFGIQ